MLITEEQKQRYTAFWERRPSDRAVLYLTSWDGSPAFPPPRDADQQWGDMDYREAATLYNVEHTRYHADAFPTVFTNFGPGSLTPCIGGSFRFSPHTIWFENAPHFVEDWSSRPTPALDESSPMWRMIEDLTARHLSHGDRFFTSITDIGGTYDILAALRGTEELLYDLYDAPEEIKKLRCEIAPLWAEVYRRETTRLLSRQGCMTSWMPIWSDKTYYPLQCDFSAMLSPEMFGEFVLPDLEAQTRLMDRAIYHLDGAGELPHLDMLLSLPRLSAIQWVPGDGNAPLTDPCWFDLYRRIQAAGKGIILMNAEIDGLERLFRSVSQRGLYILSTVRDEREADELAAMAKKLNF